jgi:hypothetical protein
MTDKQFKKFDKIISDKEKSNRIAELSKSLTRAGAFHVSPMFTPNNRGVSGGVLQKQYHTLLKNKTLGQDIQLMDDIVKERRKILQHRISCHIVLHAKGEPIAGISVYHTLIEHGQEFVSFWTGVEIDPSSFAVQVRSFANQISSLGVKGVRATTVPHRKAKVSLTTTNFVFS